MPSIWNKKEEIGGLSKNAHFGWDIVLSNNADLIAISSPLSDDDNKGLTDNGQVKVYDLADKKNIVQIGNSLNGSVSQQKFGHSIDISEDGKILAVGSPGDGNGSVGVYELKNNSWNLIGEDIDGVSNNDSFGWSVNLSNDGKLLAIGDPKYDLANGTIDVGSVKVFAFEEEQNKWLEVGNTFFGTDANQNLGYSIDLDNNLLAIGSPEINIDDKKGFVSIYQLDGTQWSQIGNDILGEKNTDESGSSLVLVSPNSELAKSTVAIGAMKNDGEGKLNSGHVRVYEYDQINNIWLKKGNDIDGSLVGDLSSYSLDISANADYLGIGSIEHNYLNNENSGQLRIFNFDQNSNIWRQSGFDIGGNRINDNFASSISFSQDGNSIAVGALNAGLNSFGEVSFFELGETSYPITSKTTDINNAIIRYSYKLLDSETGDKVTGVNLWTLDDSGQETVFDSVYSKKKYDLVIEAKTTDLRNNWNIETFDITLNLANGVFSNWDTANVTFSPNINFAKSYSFLNKTNFDGLYSQDKEGLRVTGAVGSEINNSDSINNNSFREIFRVENLSFDENVERGNENGETLAVDIISNDFDTVVSNYQDTDNNGIIDNAYIVSLNELGYNESNKSIEIDRTNEIYTYKTFAEVLDHGTTLWTQRQVGSNSKTFLIRNGSTIDGRAWWSNIGNFETELNSIVAKNVDASGNNLTLIDFSNTKNISANGENTVSGYSVTKVSNDGKASSWDDSTSESFSIDLKVKVTGNEGESIAKESFYSLDGNDFKDNEAVNNNSELLSRNIITYQGDLNYDGRVSLIDLAYLNAGKIYSNQNSFIAPNDVDANFDGEINVNDLAVLEKDFLKSIHSGIDHNSIWDETKWDVPVINSGDRAGLAVGSIESIETTISFDNSSFLTQQNIENLGIQPSLDINLSSESGY